jgi:hypothetical protein
MKLIPAGWLLPETYERLFRVFRDPAFASWRKAFLYFLTITSTSPDSSRTFAVPQVVGFPLALKRHPKRPAFFSPHCPAFTATTNHPDPDGFPAVFPCV